MSKGNPLNEALRQEVLAVDGVTDVIENRQAVHVRFENEESSSGGMCDLLSDRNRDQMQAALVSGTLPQDSHSIALDMDYAEDMIGVDAVSYTHLFFSICRVDKAITIEKQIRQDYRRRCVHPEGAG